MKLLAFNFKVIIALTITIGASLYIDFSETTQNKIEVKDAVQNILNTFEVQESREVDAKTYQLVLQQETFQSFKDLSIINSGNLKIVSDYLM